MLWASLPHRTPAARAYYDIIESHFVVRKSTETLPMVELVVDPSPGACSKSRRHDDADVHRHWCLETWDSAQEIADSPPLR
jgi:hypothetical protein